MKYLTKLISKSCIAVSLLLAVSFSANADLVRISQTVESGALGGTIASVVVEFDYSLLDSGIIDIFDYVNIGVFGVPDFLLNVYDFEAAIDTDNIFAGMEFLYFDVDDAPLSPSEPWAYQLIMDAFDSDTNFFDIFDINTTDAIFFDELDSLSFGQASVSFVSAPSVIAVFGLALAFIGFRRKSH